ncbi:Metal dependent phosphohydrolase [Chlamydiales bacterium STE3]|nr:Metal dependent phosphohydrolase [Chlamydiales bacterium STE3]
MKDLIHLFHEIGMLDTIPRSGFAFLGSGKQSVAAHSFRMTLIAYALSKEIEQPIDEKKLLLMCLLHDLPEARTGDLNYVNKRYVSADEIKVLEDLKSECRIGEEIYKLHEEYRQKETLESQIAHDADQIELMLVLKGELERGNGLAKEWLDNAKKRLTLTLAHKIAEELLTTSSFAWWLTPLLNQQADD